MKLRQRTKIDAYLYYNVTQYSEFEVFYPFSIQYQSNNTQLYLPREPTYQFYGVQSLNNGILFHEIICSFVRFNIIISGNFSTCMTNNFVLIIYFHLCEIDSVPNSIFF